MSGMKFQTSDRDRVCRLCGEKIARNTWALQLFDVHVSPKRVDLFFHEGCFTRAVGDAKSTRYDEYRKANTPPPWARDTAT